MRFGVRLFGGGQLQQQRPPLPERARNLRVPVLAAADVLCLETLRSLDAFELYRLAFVQAAVAIFLNDGVVHKDVFSSATLDKTVTFRTVKPLHSSLFFHKYSFFRLSTQLVLLNGSPGRGETRSTAYPA
jgi:hypothetical protein